MPEIVIAANWKMNKTVGQATEFARGLKEALRKKPSSSTVVIAAPFTSLRELATELKGSHISLAAQNMHFAVNGSFTGEISGEMIVDAGCKYCIIGHSERRQIFGENDTLISAKIAAAFNVGIKPIFCVGETLVQRESGTTFDVLSRQIKEGLNKVPAGDIQRIVIAYEPVWAIGTGKTATPQQAQEAHLFIRNLLGEILSEKEAADISIIYGGSVNKENISLLMAQQEINGVLVGGASLDLTSFLAIINFQ
jgi:triosephosphate isomerase